DGRRHRSCHDVADLPRSRAVVPGAGKLTAVDGSRSNIGSGTPPGGTSQVSNGGGTEPVRSRPVA
ncbi:MAG: hypothetical protein MK237_04345, partial [Gemmatimonadetes bacterium]|nr:hypothetical protein [Gemmatimonadota bacterium]